MSSTRFYLEYIIRRPKPVPGLSIELIMLICQYLSPEDLLVTAFVCKDWFNAIRNNKIYKKSIDKACHDYLSSPQSLLFNPERYSLKIRYKQHVEKNNNHTITSAGSAFYHSILITFGGLIATLLWSWLKKDNNKISKLFITLPLQKRLLSDVSGPMIMLLAFISKLNIFGKEIPKLDYVENQIHHRRLHRGMCLFALHPGSFYKTINIYMDKISYPISKAHDTDNQTMKDIYEFRDEDDEVMETIIEAFEMGDITINDPQAMSGLQAVFYLKNLDRFKVNLISDCDVSEVEFNKDYLLTKCATESILKKLYENGCIKNQAVLFQAKRHHDIFPMTPLYIDPDVNKEQLNLSFSDHAISHADAFLSESRISLFFNPLNDEELYAMRQVLQLLFREVCHLASRDSHCERSYTM